MKNLSINTGQATWGYEVFSKDGNYNKRENTPNAPDHVLYDPNLIHFYESFYKDCVTLMNHG